MKRYPRFGKFGEIVALMKSPEKPIRFTIQDCTDIEQRLHNYFSAKRVMYDRITNTTLAAFRLSNNSRIVNCGGGGPYLPRWKRVVSKAHLRADWKRYRRAKRRIPGKKLYTFTNDIIATRPMSCIGEIPGR